MLITKIAEYKVKKSQVEKVLELVAGFVKVVNTEVGTHQYLAYQKPDKVSFLHFMVFENEAAEKIHAEADYTKRFTKELYPLCVTEPKFTDLNKVD